MAESEIHKLDIVTPINIVSFTANIMTKLKLVKDL